MARPEKKLNRKQLERLEELAGGMTQIQCAAVFGINPKTLMKWHGDVYERGKAKMVEELYDLEYRVAKDIDRPESQKARQFLLKTRGGYTEKQEIEHSGVIDTQETSAIAKLELYLKAGSNIESAENEPKIEAGHADKE